MDTIEQSFKRYKRNGYECRKRLIDDLLYEDICKWVNEDYDKLSSLYPDKKFKQAIISDLYKSNLELLEEENYININGNEYEWEKIIE